MSVQKKALASQSSGKKTNKRTKPASLKGNVPKGEKQANLVRR
jgi:hypothetical protein